MRQTPPGGIMAVVANPLEKNQVGKEEELSCRSLFFVDRQRGKAIFISLWESEEAMNNSEEMMRPLRAELSEVFAANSVDVEQYEVGEMLVQEIRERELLEQELEV